MEGQWVAIYARVSSEEQRENQTIQTQIETAKRWVEFQKLVNKPMEVPQPSKHRLSRAFPLWPPQRPYPPPSCRACPGRTAPRYA